MGWKYETHSLSVTARFFLIGVKMNKLVIFYHFVTLFVIY